VGGGLPPIVEGAPLVELSAPGTGTPNVEVPGPTLNVSVTDADKGEELRRGEDPEDAFFSCVPTAGPVTRHGGSGAYIGARRDNEAEGGITYDPSIVVMIPGADMRRYSREYGRALRDGALVERSRAEYRAQMRTELEIIEAAQAAKRARREAEAAAAANETKTSTPTETGG